MLSAVGGASFIMVFVVVLHGDKEEDIFNPFCSCVALLATIKEKCNYADEIDIDLSDENGNVKNLREAPQRYANEMLSERERFVLIKVDQSNGEQTYTPLLQDDEFLSDNFFAQLSHRSNRPGSRRGRSSGKKTSVKTIPKAEKEPRVRKESIQSNSGSKTVKVTPRAKSRVK
ncbi:hypothetical protein CAPTEDRAFT_225577 [Capitella teleta]|uniref:ADF-H domain-containing protein n=1 Tax=Capitella teleta TaxID=283909 RepID=R7T541_CAPTE|nr:hypothetical protein CAPTEDRAFT_225577 [Capitella teleta]|eukprot:ELT88081.1 hypothetical protein CAPTEDRAFT_225577 [Capitella teleta]